MKIYLICIFGFSQIFSSNYFIAIKSNQGKGWENLEEYERLPCPKDRFYADPFLCKYQGKNYLFFEDFDGKKGVIAYLCLEEGREVKVALEEQTHLSFPNLFLEEDKVYMTPETYFERKVCLYRAKVFPSTWELETVLLRGAYFSDPILFKHGEYYWIFVAVDRQRLQIYYSKSLADRFISHPINRRRIIGRNAGAVFYFEDKLIRPVMDCKFGYGSSMILKEIVCLTPTIFEERVVGHIKPNWAPGLSGTHTYGVSEDYIVYDGKE